MQFRDDESQPPFLKAHLKPRYEELVDEEEDDLSGKPSMGVPAMKRSKLEEEVGLQVEGSRYLRAVSGRRKIPEGR